MSQQVIYSYAVIGLITGEHYLEDLRLRIPYRTQIPITEADFLQSKDLHRATARNLVKVIPYASIPAPYPGQQQMMVNLQGLEHQVEELRRSLSVSEQRNQGLETKLEQQSYQLTAILEAVGKIGDRQVTVVQGGNGSSKQSEVIGGEAPMFIPDNIPFGTDARIQMRTSEGDTNLDEAARKLRELKQKKMF